MRIPALRRAVQQGRYRQPATSRDGLLLDEFPRRPAVGLMFPQPAVRTWSGDLVRLDDLTGTGWRIIGWRTERGAALSAHTHQLAHDVLGARLVTLYGPGEHPTDRLTPSREILEDNEELTRSVFGGHPFVLVRPDGYVYANPTRKRETPLSLAQSTASLIHPRYRRSRPLRGRRTEQLEEEIGCL